MLDNEQILASAPDTDGGSITPPQPSFASNWARPVRTLHVGPVSSDAINLNVNGRQVAGPLKGFGQLWQKTYRIGMTNGDVTPEMLIRTWKSHFADFWPGNNRFYGSLEAIKAGDVAVLNLAGPGGTTISTGILVIYADEQSFSFMTPQGHIFAGMNTFSSFVEDGRTVAQIQVLVRAGDPLYELGCRLGVAHKQEDSFWHGTLNNLAAHFALEDAPEEFTEHRAVEQVSICVDSRMQWSEAGNIWHNAAIRTALNAPVRAVRRLFAR
ncbi:MAG: hypothetical protein KDD78_11505 [Caldilineaceae bacterium]|nr:hypothetical protein [Caldilineaceae bacterium]